MPALQTRQSLVASILTFRKEREKVEKAKANMGSYSEVGEAAYEHFKAKYDNDIREIDQKIDDCIDSFALHPQRLAKHFELAAKFWKDHPGSGFHNSVFIMTKFPDEGHPESDKLEMIIKTVQTAIRERGYYPRIARNEQKYHDLLWDNVEQYLFCCKHGVAIQENRYLPETNPNVAMEWGWMQGMGRTVIYLREKAFKERADWLGRLNHPFDWDAPDAHIQAAIRTAIATELPPLQ